MANEKFSGGTKIDKLKYVQETDFGAGAPSDPSWSDFSNHPSTISFSLDPQKEAIIGLGTVDPEEFVKGREDHEISVDYRLTSNLSSTAVVDGITRDGGKDVPNSHAVIAIEDDGTRKEITYAKGAKIDSVELSSELGAEAGGGDNPVTTSIDYVPKKSRKYTILQPASSTNLVISSSSGNDTSQTLTIESENASTTDNISLNGSNNVSSTESFGSIEAISLDAETQGDITIKDATNDSTLATLKGSNSRGDAGGDLGTPTLGAGSWGSANQSLEKFTAGDIEKPSGSDLAYVVQSVTATVENNLEKIGDIGETTFKEVEAGEREISVECDIATKDMREDTYNEVFGSTEEEILWKLQNCNLAFGGCQTLEQGDIEYNEGEVYSIGTAEYRAKNISIGS